MQKFPRPPKPPKQVKAPNVGSPTAKRKPEQKKPPKSDPLEKFELDRPGDSSLADRVAQSVAESGIPDEDYQKKVPIATQRELDQRALDKTVFKRNETVHDVTYPGTPNDPGYGAKGDGVTDDEPAVTLAIAALSVGDALYFPRGTYKLSGNVTVPAGNACIFESGAKISIDNTFIFTVNGPLIADLHQTFDGAGTIDISGAEIWEISPRWFGNAVVTLFTDQDATPSVNRGRVFQTANTVLTTYTDFGDGIPGQRITILINDAFTKFDLTGSNLQGNAGADWNPVAGDSTDAVLDESGNWWLCAGGESTGGGGGATKTAQMVISRPDLEDVKKIPLLYAHADYSPNGVTILSCGIATDAASTYSVDFEIWTDPTTFSQAIETVATSGTSEAQDDGTLTNSAVAVGDYVFMDLPVTSVGWVMVWITFTID